MTLTDLDYKIIGILVTTVVAAIVSAITSLRTTRQELKKVPYDIMKAYADNLQKQRLLVYPKYYQMLSDLIKRTERKQISIEFLDNWLDNYLKLDSENSLILSGEAANLNYSFYRNLDFFINKYKKINSINYKEFYSELDACEPHSIETILKRDLGIFDVEFDPKKGKAITSYFDIYKLSKKNNLHS